MRAVRFPSFGQSHGRILPPVGGRSSPGSVPKTSSRSILPLTMLPSDRVFRILFRLRGTEYELISVPPDAHQAGESLAAQSPLIELVRVEHLWSPVGHGRCRTRAPARKKPGNRTGDAITEPGAYDSVKRNGVPQDAVTSVSSSSAGDAITFERRRSIRFLIERELHYITTSQRGETLSGYGQTLNISSSGVLFHAQHDLAIGTQLEVVISWPAQLNEKCSLNLVVRGQVVRKTTSRIAVEIQQHEFRTQAKR